MLPQLDSRLKLPKNQRQLLAVFEKLVPEDQHALLQYARFLQSGQVGGSGNEEQSAVPEIPAESVNTPEDESVIAAMRRLSEKYFMLEGEELLNQAAACMSEHVLQGRDKEDVIHNLETLFDEQYQTYCQTFRK